MKRLNRDVARGDRVLIFQMPFTEEQEEGWATVVKVHQTRDFISDGKRVNETRARVRFDGESASYDRTIVGDPVIEK